MYCQVAQHGLALIHAGLCVAVTKNLLRAGFVNGLAELELAGFAVGTGTFCRPAVPNPRVSIAFWLQLWISVEA